MVAAAQPEATRAGVAMLEQGGNAADAAVAAGFAISVVEPTMNSIGGRNQILIRTARGEFAGIDGTTQAPMTYDPETAPQASYGYPTVGVPGALAGLLKLHAEHGTLPLATVMEPAIRLASSGFRVLPGEAMRQGMASEQVAEFTGSAAHFLKGDGSPQQAGDVFVQEDLANTLRAIRDQGRDVFYRGEIAQRMAEDIQANGGAVTLQSLGEYEAVDATVVRGSYRGYDLVGLFTPAAGATSIEILHILENFDMAAMDDVQWAALVGQAFRLAYEDYRAITGPGAAEQLTSKEWAAQRAAEIRVPEGALARAAMAPGSERESVRGWAQGDEWVEPTRVAAAMDRVDPASASPPPADPDAWINEQHHTTHLTVADGNGMMVALTQTIGPNMGSKVATPGLGFLYAATLGGYLGDMEPGERARSFISPFMVMRDGEPFMAMGAAGGGRIPVAILNTLLRIIDQGMSLEDGLAAARVAPEEEGFQLETSPGIGWSPDVVTALEEQGWTVSTQDRSGAFGRVHAVRWDAQAGQWVGGADPDWEGSADGPGNG
jgi:gamma-glutamyltranspeptidase/glutathione hydrolase